MYLYCYNRPRNRMGMGGGGFKHLGFSRRNTTAVTLRQLSVCDIREKIPEISLWWPQKVHSIFTSRKFHLYTVLTTS